MQVNVLDAKNQLSSLIRRAQAGEAVVIANRGRPVARLVPEPSAVDGAGERGRPQAVLDWLVAHPLPSYVRQRSAEDIEAGIEEERGAWD